MNKNIEKQLKIYKICFYMCVAPYAWALLFVLSIIYILSFGLVDNIISQN